MKAGSPIPVLAALAEAEVPVMFDPPFPWTAANASDDTSRESGGALTPPLNRQIVFGMPALTG